MRVLVTGATGFIARHAFEPLTKAGAELHGVARRPADQDGPWQLHSADLLDAVARRELIDGLRPDVVLHAAWVTEHGKFWHAAENIDWAAATLDLARLAHNAGAHRFVGVGTCAEYAPNEDRDCEEFTTPIGPQTLYAIAKDGCRRTIAGYAAETGLSFAWARLFLLYGPGEAPGRLVAHVARSVLAGEPAPMSSGKVVRDFMDARDAGAALAALALSPVEGPVNVASGKTATIRDVAETVARLAGRPELVQPGALPDRDEAMRLTAGVHRLRDEVGFRDIRPLEQGLAETVDYWRKALGRG